jgi:DNA-binding CsgD family transcriptional regulator
MTTLGVLSRRELEVLAHVLQGRTSDRIAALCHISPKTVEVHRMHIGRKLGVHSPVELFRLAVALGWLERRDGEAKITFVYERALARGYEAVAP